MPICMECGTWLQSAKTHVQLRAMLELLVLPGGPVATSPVTNNEAPRLKAEPRRFEAPHPAFENCSLLRNKAELAAGLREVLRVSCPVTGEHSSVGEVGLA